MGSANGRHRRPRQAPAIVVAAGVTGSAIAIPLLGAGAAQAAGSATWDKVAECESGGSWSADFGNGSYGGLQFTPELWKAYGGEAYAERADLASRAQQIAVAEKVLEDRGPKAWPSCAVISGLAGDGTLPGVDPGTAPSDESAQSAEGNEDEGSAKGSGKAKGDQRAERAKPADDASAPPSEKSDTHPGSDAKPSATPSATPPSGSHRAPESGDMAGSPTSSASSEAPGDAVSGDASAHAGGKHRGTPAAEEGWGAGGGIDRESGRHASRGDGGARDAAAAAEGGTYTVHPGDNLWAIADAQNVPGGWPALYEANKGVVGDDPDLILPGQSLELDVTAGPGAH